MTTTSISRALKQVPSLPTAHSNPVRLRRSGILGQIAWYVYLLLLAACRLPTCTQSCTMDMLMHLPRSAFSERQMDLFAWLLKANGANDVPSVDSMRDLNHTLREYTGIRTLPYDGAFGHRYYVNSLSDIIAQVNRVTCHVVQCT